MSNTGDSQPVIAVNEPVPTDVAKSPTAVERRGRLPEDESTDLNRLGELNLGHILAAAQVNPADVAVIRHSHGEGGIPVGNLNAAGVLTYTRQQGTEPGHKLGKTPRPIWLVFIADGARRCRFFCTYDNLGELAGERTVTRRYFDLRESDLFRALRDRLVIEWTKDTINWAKKGASASTLRVVEIADREAVEFPGNDKVLLTHRQLQLAVADSRYASWRTALGSVQGIYLIADTSTGHLYVGKADGHERILGRWSQYARDGHGGNIVLRDLVGQDADHPHHFQFSILRVFDAGATQSEVDAAEAHYKRALLTRRFGLNRN